MIQRIQSVYLLLAAVVQALAFLFPFASATPAAEGVFQDGSLDINDHIVLPILLGLGAALSVGTIFLFKNRPLQITLDRLTMVLIFATLAFVGVLNFGGVLQGTLDLSFFLLGIAVILLFLAQRGIRNDERIVRSADRLR